MQYVLVSYAPCSLDYDCLYFSLCCWRQCYRCLLWLEFFLSIGNSHAIVSADRDLLLTLALGFGLLMIVQHLVSLLQTWAGMYLSTSLNIQWKANVFRRLMDLPVSYFTKRHLGDVVSRFGSVDSILCTLTSTFFVLVLNSIMAVFVLGLMYLYSPSFSSVVLVVLLIYIGIRWVAYYPLRHATEENIVHAASKAVISWKPYAVFKPLNYLINMHSAMRLG